MKIARRRLNALTVTASIVLVLGAVLGAARAAPPMGEVVFNQNFQSIPADATLSDYGLIDNSEWHGNTAPLSIVTTGRNRALQSQVSGFAQLLLGHVRLQKGETYRISMAVATSTPQNVEMQLRQAGEPYATYIISTQKANPTPRKLTFSGVAPESADAALIVVRVTGTATVVIDDITVERLDKQGAAALAGERKIVTLYEQDFDTLDLGKPPYPFHDDSGWNGATVPLTVVDSGNDTYGKVLQAEVDGFGQLLLGQAKLIKDEVYRVSITMSSGGQHRPEIYLRKAGNPYTTYLTGNADVGESVKTFTLIGKAPVDDDAASVMLKMNGQTTLVIYDIKVEHLQGGLPPGAMPVAGNMVLNAGFELGRDGWLFTRPGTEIIPDPGAFEGKMVARVPAGEYLYSPWMDLSYRGTYLTRLRVKALRQPIAVNLMMTNLLPFKNDQEQDIHQTQMRIAPEDGWKAVSLKWRPNPERNEFRPTSRYYIKLTSSGPDGAAMLVDAAQVQALLTPDELNAPEPPAYAPHAPVERALFTDAPQNVYVQGEPVTIEVRATGPDQAMNLVVVDETGKPTRTVPLKTTDGQAAHTFTDLPNGYWQLLTEDTTRATGQPAAVQGETFVAVVPPMPDLAIEDWAFGSHIPPVVPVRAAFWKLGLRWNRLHDVTGIAKWRFVEPEPGQWIFDDKTLDLLTAEGEGILGVLDQVPDWARAEKDRGEYFHAPSPADDPGFAHWLAYVDKTVSHWKGRIDDWEVMNEPNFARITPAQYLEILKATTPVIRKANPDATVVGLGGPLVESPWLTEAIALGVGKYSDAVSFHGYTDVATWRNSAGPWPLIDAVKGMRQKLAQAGSPEIPIWNTEFGTGVQSSFTKFPTFAIGSTSLSAAIMTPKSVAAAEAAGVARTFYYAAFDVSGPHQAGSLGWLNDLNGTVNKCAQPMAVAIAQLSGRKYQSVEAPPTNLVHLTFVGRGATVHMLWAAGDAVTAKVPPGTTQLIDMWGRTMPLAREIKLGSEVVYAIAPQ